MLLWHQDLQTDPDLVLAWYNVGVGFWGEADCERAEAALQEARSLAAGEDDMTLEKMAIDALRLLRMFRSG